MTAEDLSRLDGKEGRPALLSYRGVVHDATGKTLWKGGTRAGKHLAGFDLTDALRLAPRRDDRIAALPVVAILFVISLRRWG